MRRITPHIALAVAGATLLAVMTLLTTSRLEYCCQTDIPEPRVAEMVSVAAPSPTLAPPRQMVFVRVETDESDIAISWAED